MTLTWDGLNVYLYINGVECGSTPQTVDADPGSTHDYAIFAIGAQVLSGPPAS